MAEGIKPINEIIPQLKWNNNQYDYAIKERYTEEKDKYTLFKEGTFPLNIICNISTGKCFAGKDWGGPSSEEKAKQFKQEYMNESYALKAPETSKYPVYIASPPRPKTRWFGRGGTRCLTRRKNTTGKNTTGKKDLNLNPPIQV